MAISDRASELIPGINHCMHMVESGRCAVSQSTCTMAHIRLFEGALHAKSYLKFRPTYPAELYQKIMCFLNEKRSPPHTLHLDVGCGSGQGTYDLSSYFERVIGMDISEAQVEAATGANTKSNVEFRVSAAEELPVDDHTVDLITSATAAHFFDFEAFCCECRRVLKPDGCLAVFSYGFARLEYPDATKNVKLNEDFDNLLHRTIGPYWDKKIQLPLRGYVDLNIPFPGFSRDSLSMKLTWTVSHLIGYIMSLSAYQKHLKAEPSSQVLKEYQDKVMAVISTPGASPDDTSLDIIFPIYLLLGRTSCQL